MSKEINLEEILKKYNWKELRFGKTAMKEAMIEFGKQLLELAAENAEVKKDLSSLSKTYGAVWVDKDSIKNAINKVK